MKSVASRAPGPSRGDDTRGWSGERLSEELVPSGFPAMRAPSLAELPAGFTAPTHLGGTTTGAVDSLN